MTDNESLESALKPAVEALGAEINGNVPKPLYDFLRRYGPMACVDVALVPEGKTPSILLAKRGMSAVAPGAYYLIGGRIDKSVDVLGTIRKKIRSEIGIDAGISWKDLIGLSMQSWLPDQAEIPVRDYSSAVIAPCFAIRASQEQIQKASAGDGHTDWKVFTGIDPNWHAHVRLAAAYAWDRFYGRNWRENASPEVRDALAESPVLIPLRYEGQEK